MVKYRITFKNEITGHNVMKNYQHMDELIKDLIHLRQNTFFPATQKFAVRRNDNGYFRVVKVYKRF